ncbi:p53-like transcription factor [Aspergillus welwitschiae]|uniref:p53-like transcription factor n=1 Tax=Aspergillus welwitschiae TaxID=1341132 RepID=A0A3F3PIJ0_9EURO|nr:p53-like transcription factor [Aspergillus welwitschiae]RDH26774.1 p53-like transcription factor [Aspergillus welwitschiae]
MLYDRGSNTISHRVSPLQPSADMSLSLQSQKIVVPGSASTTGRSDWYPEAYSLHQQLFLTPLSDMGKITRTARFATADRALKNCNERSQAVYLGAENMLMGQAQGRLPEPFAGSPPFYDTILLLPIVCGTSFLKPEILAEIHKGFFQVDDKWTCYRRNYFSISCSFTLQPWSSAPLYVKVSDQWTERITRFAMSISAIVNQQVAEIRDLVQHSPKRDKQSGRNPRRVILQPCQPEHLVVGHEASSSSIQHGFSKGYHSTERPLGYEEYPGVVQPSQPPYRHTFERVQFQRATANNGKRRAQQQYYNLVVELYAEVASSARGTESQWIRVARRFSHPMVVRGRSPNHFKKKPPRQSSKHGSLRRNKK